MSAQAGAADADPRTGTPADPEPCEELVVALVAALGTDLDVVEAAIEDAFSEFDYRTHTIRLSARLAHEDVRSLTSPVSPQPEYERIKSSMSAGDTLRGNTSDDFLAQLAVAEIATLRLEEGQPAAPMGRRALILRSLKRPEEVYFLRSIYGSRLVVISVFVGDAERRRQLGGRGLDEKEVAELIKRDRDGGEHGQATTRTFELGDLFVDASLGREHASKEVQRFLDLVFGSPLVTPTRHEHAMFLAFSASLRSGDLSRQVGAVVATSRGAIVGEGANDAPRFGGGQYWPKEGHDFRDIAKGYDSNETIKDQMIRKLANLPPFESLGEAAFESARGALKQAGFLEITEFGRAVHAEMAALMSCARLGVSTRERLLYCTTFPCHNCAKHIVAAGISTVYFIEPYPKSRAFELHPDSVGEEGSTGKVIFRPFIGVGPRRYVELFALRDPSSRGVRRKGSDGRRVTWRRASSRPALPDQQDTYLERETRVLTRVAARLEAAPTVAATNPTEVPEMIPESR